MDDVVRRNERISAVVLGVGVGLISGFLLWVFASAAGSANTDKYWKLQAIQYGYALYCPETGEWAWKDQCAAAAKEP